MSRLGLATISVCIVVLVLDVEVNLAQVCGWWDYGHDL